MRYQERITIRVYNSLAHKLAARANRAGHGNISIEARAILEKELKVRRPRVERAKRNRAH